MSIVKKKLMAYRMSEKLVKLSVRNNYEKLSIGKKSQ